MRSGVRVRSSGCVKANHVVNIIRISAVKLDSNNIESNFCKGKIKFECSSGLTQEECLNYLKNNLIECKMAICKSSDNQRIFIGKNNS